MTLFHIFLVIIAFALLGFALFTIMVRKRDTAPADYYMLFLVGLASLPIGMLSRAYAFTGMAAVIMIIGLLHTNLWKQNHRAWQQLDARQRMGRVLLVAWMVAAVIATGISIYLSVRK